MSNINSQNTEELDKSLVIDNFDNFGLKENLLRGIYSYGFEKPSIIQSKAIPLIMSGKEVIAQSQSGTGKTGAFTISVLQLIDENVNAVQGIILAHTRELAQQIYGVCGALGYYLNMRPVLCIGGQDIKQTRMQLENSPVIVIGTPGRIIDLIKRRYISTRFLKILIVDEADEMLSHSFKEQVRNVVTSVPTTTNICLFSATLPKEMLELTKKFMKNPERLLIEKENLTLDGIKQFYIDVENDLWKFETFCDIYDIISVSQTIVYVNSIKRGKDLKQELEDKKFTVSLIHSNMDVFERGDIMKQFRNGGTRILISTDLLSRGIDIQQISVVINYDIPRNKECYLHRIGRSGRFGKKGVAINLMSKYEQRLIDDIKHHYKTTIEPMPNNIQSFLC